MGFFDKVVELANELGEKTGQNPDLVKGVADILQNKGISGIIDDFKNKGLTDIVSSWVGTGPNSAISPDQIKQALGNEKIQQLAEKAGVSPENASRFLKEVLPGLIDKLTPGGQVPPDSNPPTGSGS